MRRYIRLAALAVGVLGLVATSAPPSSATTTGTAELVGTAVLDAPLEYPWVAGTDPSPDDGLPDDLDPTFATTCHPFSELPLPDSLITPNPTRQCHPDPGGHTRAVLDIISVGCVGDGVNVDKPGKDPAHAGECTFSDAPGKFVPPLFEGNHVHGFCGASGGQVQVTFTDPLGQTYTLDIHFTGIGTTLFITGHWRKLVPNGQTGLVTGEVTATPVPDPLGQGNSCATSTARVFTIVGEVNMTPHV